MQTVQIAGGTIALRDDRRGPVDTDAVVPWSGAFAVSASQILKVRASVNGSTPERGPAG